MRRRRSSRSRSRKTSRAQPRSQGQSLVLPTRSRLARSARPTFIPEGLPPRKSVRRKTRVLTRDQVRAGLRDRRNKMLARKKATRSPGLSAALVPSRRTDADARSRPSKLRCARKKEVRRAVIIATGHGGRNGVRNYRRQQKCR